ncbi:MAG TPA: ATP-binding cassette domain-containing protein [Candidatus Methanofastidiosa archaeon]|nr:ATP-binding cassette domain-containing protein [Candidatus Methanofastidiosa archaeon]HPR41688.1 ATP-binding cassette domain-containing protein [Candidatus Methanofastidiosa archaeon]
MDRPLLEVKNLTKYFSFQRGLFRKETFYLRAVDDVSFSLERKKTLGIVGESGCGKTTLGKTLVGLYKPDSGSITLTPDGKSIDMVNPKDDELKTIRKTIQMVFQDPQSSLNPRWPIRNIVGEPLEILKLTRGRKEKESRVIELLETVGLKPEHINRYPHEFSGGQRQRIGIARALASQPDLIVLDEPTSAVDVSVQAQVLNLLRDLQKERNMSYIFISHDLGVVHHMADEIAVQYLGQIVEYGDSEKVFNNPLHPYTKALLSALPVADPEFEAHKKRIILKGTLPNAINPPSGCRFHTRCQELVDEKRCKSECPMLREVEKDHKVACWIYD